MSELLESREFWIGVASSLVATFLGFVFVVVYRYIGTRVPLLLQTRKLATTIKIAGIEKVFVERASYVRDPDHGSIPTYIQRATSSLVYVGLWLSHGVEDANITGTIEAMAAQGRKITLVMLDFDIDPSHKAALARYLGTSEIGLTSRLQESWQHLVEKRNRMSVTAQANIVLKRHRELLTASAFLIDANLPSGRTLIDLKFFAVPREKTIGIEFRPQRHPAELYTRVTNSFLAIANYASQESDNLLQQTSRARQAT